jgi:AhpD family alkylhydroperoxidase
MEPRIPWTRAVPAAYQAIWALERHVRASELDRRLLDLVYLRVSQMNGCAFCVDMHAKELRAAGDTEQRVYSLAAWRETPFYSERERAALAWAEAVTSLGSDHVGDELFERTRRFFSEPELVELTLAVATINAWNRMGIAFRSVAGAYEPGQRS